MASSSAPQTLALASTSVALTAETASPHTGGCGVTTARSMKPKFFMARAAAPMLFGSRGRTSTILLFPIFLRRDGEEGGQGEGETRRQGDKDRSVSLSSCLPCLLVFLRLLLGLRSRSQDMIFFADRVERDAALLQISDLAQIRGQRRSVTADDVRVGQGARLHAVEEVADVLLFERLGGLNLDRRRRRGPAPGGGLLVDVTGPVNVEP